MRSRIIDALVEREMAEQLAELPPLMATALLARKQMERQQESDAKLTAFLDELEREQRWIYEMSEADPLNTRHDPRFEEIVRHTWLLQPEIYGCMCEVLRSEREAIIIWYAAFGEQQCHFPRAIDAAPNLRERIRLDRDAYLVIDKYPPYCCAVLIDYTHKPSEDREVSLCAHFVGIQPTHQSALAAGRDAWHLHTMPYHDYLATDHWLATRRAALERSRFRCDGNARHTQHLEVHHRTYVRRGWERVTDDLRVFCRSCHGKLHGRI